MWRKGGGRRTFQVEELRNDRVFCVGMSMGKSDCKVLKACILL
jgi:hypothetical protein